MIKIKIITVGKIKEKFLVDAIKEYSKRLSRYCKLSIIEISDERDGKNIGDIENALLVEGNKIKSNIGAMEYVISMDIEGEAVSSNDIADIIENTGIRGYSTITFIIGGSNGIASNIKEESNKKISFGKITLPHQLFRVILLEQIYRGFKIINKEPYHK